jgi:putative transposase
MVRKRYTEEQIIAVLNEAEAGARTADLCRKHGVSDATFYNWKAKYAGFLQLEGQVRGPDGKRAQELTVSELKRLKSLEDENRRLKQIVAHQALDNWALKELLSKNF